ncbi:MAG: CorA metal ion transporter [Thelocarpon superellum]|nr:MAG: CorA metal ion transporter [Thelocarpon superellum]
MAAPNRLPTTASGQGSSPRPGLPGPTNVSGVDGNAPSSPAAPPQDASAGPSKKRRHRGQRKRRGRRPSFAAHDEDAEDAASAGTSHKLMDHSTPSRPDFYHLGRSGGNLSSTSLESEALLDHRDQQPLRPRRPSTMAQGSFSVRSGQLGRTTSGMSFDGQPGYRQSFANPFVEVADRRHRSTRARPESEDEEVVADDRTPLLSTSHRETTGGRSFFGGLGRNGSPKRETRTRDSSTTTSTSSRRRRRGPISQASLAPPSTHDVNNPPSMPPSPKIGPNVGYGDVMVPGDFAQSRYPETSLGLGPLGRESVINIDAAPEPDGVGDGRRRTMALPAEGDVCFPVESMSEMADDDLPHDDGATYRAGRRRRVREWPDLSVLDDWSREEKEERSEGIRTKKISEPVLVGGRLRPNKAGWHRTEEDAPYRFTYFNEEFPSTIHSQTISELLQPGQTFREFFIPEPPLLSDDESTDEEVHGSQSASKDETRHGSTTNGESRHGTRHGSIAAEAKSATRSTSGEATPGPPTMPPLTHKKYGARPTFWLDVLSPTDAEMRVLAKTFGIHPLTAEDIMMQEAREKVELFRNYYFVNYRTFEQDMNSDTFLEPVDMYVVVFREGVISFHFSMVPHPANVRRRIRQLKDYLILSSDWISYAIIDDITDVFAPLIQSIEDEVDDIDDDILQLHSPSDPAHPASTTPKTPKTPKTPWMGEKKSEAGDATAGEKGGDMLRRVGDCRKKVMGLYRLLGNKADVIKGFAKRCNEQWEIAPRSEIGLYLGDIQDHIVTMTSNLSHYEKILSRSHSNYLAQINIRMNERQEQTADVLGRLTVLGTIVLPMNIITGLWGMNCLVPGQDVDNLHWFWGITAGLLLFGFMCYFMAKRVYKIV